MNAQPQFHITTFYSFANWTAPEVLQKQDQMYQEATQCGVKGLAIIAHEGVNSTLCGTGEQISNMKNWVRENIQSDIFFKDSTSEKPVFRRFVIKQKEEIVTTTSPELAPDTTKNHHLSPSEWNEVLKNETDYYLVDTRNWYETKIGKFQKAVDPKIDQFTEFPEFVDKQNLSKDKKILMYCTGGIRCEKGILELQKKGYNNVYQLEGGILNYLKEFPNDEFEGECFVFDGRVAVDQGLNPSRQYELCPHTGQPAEIEITCVRCGSIAKISTEIRDLNNIQSETCSKNCAYHWELNPGRKGKKQQFSFERPPLKKNKVGDS